MQEICSKLVLKALEQGPFNNVTDGWIKQNILLRRPKKKMIVLAILCVKQHIPKGQW